MNTKGIKVNILGDSITAGVGASEQSKRFADVFAALSGADVANYGVSGSKIAHSTSPDITWSFCERAPKMRDDADLIIVFGGTNDYKHPDGAPFGEFGDTEPTTFCGACDHIMRLLINKYPKAQIMFMTPLHRCEEELAPHGVLLETYRDNIMLTAAKYSIPVLDLWSVSGIQPNIEINKVTYMPDGLHPNDFGHQRVAERLMGFVSTL